MRLSLLLLLFVVNAICICRAATSITNVALLDSHGSNFLFRGGDTAPQGVFLYDDLVAEMRRIAPLPAVFNLVSYNFLWNSTAAEYASILAELAYWQQNPSKGRTILQPLYGAEVDPDTLPLATVKAKVKRLSDVLDDLPGLFTQIRTLLKANSSIPTVVYVHCSCGCDRTGEVGASYLMQYKNLSLSDARNAGIQIIKRDMAYGNIYGTKWYCYYLKYQVAGFSGLTCQYKGPGAIELPSCPMVPKQDLVSYWKVGNIFHSLWSVNVTNTNKTATVPYYALYALEGASDLVRAWGATVPPSQIISTTQTGLLAGQTYSWSYEMIGTDPMRIISVYPDACLSVEPQTAIYPADDNCHLSITQSITGSGFNLGGAVYIVTVSLSNTSPTLPVYAVALTMSDRTVSVWGLDRAYGNIYALPTAVNGIPPSGTYSFSYAIRTLLPVIPRIGVSVPSACN